MQKQMFLAEEGDEWFNRNKNTIEQNDLPYSYKIIQKYIKKTDEVLEIGCSSGSKINLLNRKLKCTCYGVDPSSKAIEYGIQVYPKLHLQVGTADELPYGDDSFSVVIVGFCMYLVDRKLLSKTVYQIDRVLKDKGIMVINDFDSIIPKKRKYKHKEGLYSYKMDYSKLFLSNPSYTLIERRSYSMLSEDFVYDKTERVATTVLVKDENSAYEIEKDK